MDSDSFSLYTKTDKDLNICFISWALVAVKPDVLVNSRVARLFMGAMSLLQDRTSRGTYIESDGSKTSPVKIIIRMRGGMRTMCYSDKMAACSSASGLLITYDDTDTVMAVIEVNHVRLNRIAVRTDRMGYGHDIAKIWMAYNENAKDYYKDGVNACVPTVATADHSVVPFFEKLGLIRLASVAPADMPSMPTDDTPMLIPATAEGLTNTTNALYIAYMKEHMPAWNKYWINISGAYMSGLGVQGVD